MDDVTLTQLFARMDAHLARQDAYLAQQDVHLAGITETQRRQNAVLQETAQLLATTAQEVAAIHAEASRQHAATMQLCEALIARLEEDR